MERLGVEVVSGSAHFLDPRTIKIGSRKLSVRIIVIATGSRAGVPVIPGLGGGDYITNETIFSLSRQPRKLAVLGAGPAGIELAQAFRRLGSEVAPGGRPTFPMKDWNCASRTRAIRFPSSKRIYY